jgi:L-alanine-DL-glutamate epimerase-like enolase superfamily enzyme
MIDVIESACAVALESGPQDSVFDLWHRVYRECVVRGATNIAPLLAGFGVSVVERAVVDAFCRAINVPFAVAVRANELGIRLGSIHPALAGHDPREFLPRRPMTSLSVRHTVGLGDPLAVGDDGGVVPPDDLPSTLEAWIRRYGLRRFKVKVSGDHRVDLDRLERIRDVLDGETRGDYRVTIDGNEQSSSPTSRLCGRSGRI